MNDVEQLEKEFNEFKNEISEFMGGLKQWMSTTTEYRKSLCDKITEIKESLSNLPCKERATRYTSFDNQLRMIWLFLAGIVAAIIVEWLKKI